MRKMVLLLLLTFVASCAYLARPQEAFAQRSKQRDKIKATKTVTGTFKSFEMGDYFHATIAKADGEELSFFVSNTESVSYFLVAHKGKPLTLTYHIVDTYIPEAGGRQTIERLVAAKAGRVTDKAWWTKQRAGSSLKKLRAKYNAMVEASTVSN